jgi:hypothetical protein
MPMAALTISVLFLDDPEALRDLAWTARRSHCRPSALLDLHGMPAYQIDRAAAVASEPEAASGENVIEW